MNENVAPLWQRHASRNFAPSAVPERNEIAELLLAGRRQGSLITLCACMGLAFGVFHYATSPKQYYSSSTVLIEERHSDLDQEISSLRPLSRNETGFENQMQILRSAHLATEVVRMLGLQDIPDFHSPPRSTLGLAKSHVMGQVRSLLPKPEQTGDGAPASPEDVAESQIRKAASRLARQTLFFRSGKSYSVEIGYLSHDPALAVAIANAYAEAYLADGMEANLQANQRTADWMRERIEGLKKAALDAAVDASAFRAENGAMDQQGLREREQRVDALNDLYETIEAQYQETLIAGSYPVANGRVLSHAMVAERPSDPKAWRLLLAGLVAGLMGGLGLATLRELRETGFRTPGDLRAKGLTLLGYLPLIAPRDLRAVRHFSAPGETMAATHHSFTSSRSISGIPGGLRAATAAAPLHLQEPFVMDCAAPELVLSVQAQPSPYQLGVRNILASIGLEIDEGKGRIVAVGGLVEGEGATTLAANLANLAARSGRRTLLVDGDLDRADLTFRLDLQGATVSEGPLARTRRFSSPLRRLAMSGLDVLPAAAPDGLAFDASRVAAFGKVLESVRDTYDLIVVDLPPLCQKPDTKSWLRMIDGIVLVVGWGTTRRSLIESYLDREPEMRKRVLGVVLNRTIPGKLGRYGVPSAPGPEEAEAATF